MITDLSAKIFSVLLLAGAVFISRPALGQEEVVGDLAQPAAVEEYGDMIPCDECSSYSRYFGGAEYRYLRTHFSEGLGYAVQTDTVGPGGLNRQVKVQELNFDYDSTFRVFVGRHLNDGAELKVSYWYFDTDTRPGETVPVGSTVTDPFGNAGAAGDLIQTQASVNLNVFDVEYIKPLNFQCEGLDLRYGAGLRFAEISQFYSADIFDAAGPLQSSGVFNVDFFGVGPNLTLEGVIHPAWAPRLSAFAKGGASILVGQYEIGGGVIIPGVITAMQEADRTRAVPVLESELGLSWEPVSGAILSTGWSFQSWWNMGASGGSFGGVFTAADDSDIMSFDGLFVRAELKY